MQKGQTGILHAWHNAQPITNICEQGVGWMGGWMDKWPDEWAGECMDG